MNPTSSCSRFLKALLPGLLCVAGAGAQQPLVLSLGGAARLAAERGAGPQAGRLRAEQAEARVRQRRAELLPSISAGVSDGERTFNSATFGITFRDPLTGRPLFDPNGEVLGPVRAWDVRGSVRQSIADFSSVARLRAARSSARAADADAALAAQQAGAAAALAYVRTLRAEAQLGSRAADSALAGELLVVARDQLAAGVGIALDVTRAQAQVASAYAQLIAARNERDRSRLELHRALGLPLDVALTLAGALTAVPAGDALPTEAEATDCALRTRADLRAASELIAAAEAEVTAMRAERLPTISAFLDKGTTGKSTDHLLGTYTWGLQVSVPVFDGFRREGRIDEQRSLRRELDVRRRDLEQQAAIDVRAALLEVVTAREQLAAWQERLALAEQELAQARDRFTSGVAGNGDVIAASLGLNAARTLVVDAMASVESSRVALARAQGIVTELP